MCKDVFSISVYRYIFDCKKQITVTEFIVFWFRQSPAEYYWLHYKQNNILCGLCCCCCFCSCCSILIIITFYKVALFWTSLISMQSSKCVSWLLTSVINTTALIMIHRYKSVLLKTVIFVSNNSKASFTAKKFRGLIFLRIKNIVYILAKKTTGFHI